MRELGITAASAERQHAALKMLKQGAVTGGIETGHFPLRLNHIIGANSAAAGVKGAFQRHHRTRAAFACGNSEIGGDVEFTR
jgi:hypothetical protein